MNIRFRLSMLVCLALLLGGVSWAQQKTAIAWETFNELGGYTQDHRITVEDFPGHIMRTYEVAWDFTDMDDPPRFNGVAAVSAMNAGITDYYDFNGYSRNYMVFTLETGEKIYSRSDGIAFTTFADDGSPNSSNGMLMYIFTGGTGDFIGIRGVLRQSANWNLATDKEVRNPIVFEGEYWFIDDQQASY